MCVCYIDIVDVCSVWPGRVAVCYDCGRDLRVLACHPVHPIATHINHTKIMETLLSHMALHLGLLDAEDEGFMILWKVGYDSPSDTASHQRTSIFRHTSFCMGSQGVLPLRYVKSVMGHGVNCMYLLLWQVTPYIQKNLK
jgi:hypothetical protein